MYLELKDITKSYGEEGNRTQVLRGISCSIGKGEICVLLGPSGSGKSTLLNIIGGIDSLDSGSVTIDGSTIERMNEKQLSKYRRNHLGYVFQSYNLIPNLTVKENIEVGAYLSEKPLPLQELMETLGLTAHRDKLPNQISGGMQKRVGIARAIALNPKYLFCDEPNSGLDPTTSIVIDRLIQEITREYQITTVINTHDMNSVMGIGDHIGFIHQGKLVWEGSNKEIMNSDCQPLNDFVFANNLARQLKKNSL